MMTAEAREAWLRERTTYIGASEAAEAVGLSPWGDPISLWERKTGQAPEKDATFRMTLGLAIEPVIGRLFSEQTGLKIVRPAGQNLFPPRPIRHKRYPFIASNPDFRVVGQRALVQAKLHVGGTEWGDPEAPDAIPMHYRVQGWAELLTTGLDLIYFAKLDPFEGLSVYPLARPTDGTIEDLEADLVDYWQSYVVPVVMPPPTAASSDALARRFPRPLAKIGRVASAEQEAKIVEIVEARDAVEAAKERLEGLKNDVKAWIGDAAWIEGGGYRAAWGTTTRTNVAWKEIAASLRKRIEGIEGALGNAESLATLQAELDTMQGLFTTTETSRGPFTIAKQK